MCVVSDSASWGGAWECSGAVGLGEHLQSHRFGGSQIGSGLPLWRTRTPPEETRSLPKPLDRGWLSNLLIKHTECSTSARNIPSSSESAGFCSWRSSDKEMRIRISCSASLDWQCTHRTFAQLKPGRSCRAGTLILTSPLYSERLGNTLTPPRKKQNKTNPPPPPKHAFMLSLEKWKRNCLHLHLEEFVLPSSCSRVRTHTFVNGDPLIPRSIMNFLPVRTRMLQLLRL